MSIDNIYIFSRAIRNGKTTELQDWIKNKKNVSGFLTPDVDEKRKLYDIASATFHDLELPENTTEETISIGKFVFSKKAFDAAKVIINAEQKEWLIVDEAGKLEIEQNKGLEPELTEMISRIKSDKSDKKLILVIRDTLLEKAVIKYELAGAKIIHSLTTL